MTVTPSDPAAPPPAPHDGRLVAVDILRALAALAVVLTHIPRPVPRGFDLQFLATLPLDFGMLGVPMFIVISGFCIHLGYARRLATGRVAGWSWSAFWKRRFVRLYPTYLAAIAFSLAVVYAMTAWGGTPHELPEDRTWDVITHLLMIHNLTSNFTGGLGNPPFWTLGLEEQLYGLFAVVVLLRARMSAVKILGIGLVVSVVWRVGQVWVPFLMSRYAGTPAELTVPVGPLHLGHWKGWPFGWWFFWLLGAVAAEVHVGLLRVPRWLTSWWAIIVAGAVTSVTHWRTLGRYSRNWLKDEGSQGWLKATLNTVVEFSDLVFAVGCFALLLRLIQIERAGGLTSRLARVLGAIGVMSYSLYLTHGPIMSLLGPVLETPKDASGMFVPLVAGVSASLAFAAVFFVLFERPFLRRLPRSRG